MATKIIPIGTVFGRLTVVGIGDPIVNTDGKRVSTSVVVCSCGETRSVRNNSLNRGHTESCGCLWKESITTHGLHSTPEYRSWTAMIHRTTSQKHKYFARYGGRGITICERWLEFENFLTDMGPRPSGNHSIERDNNDGNYEPANCRWATKTEQQNNRRNNVRLMFYGKSLTITQWSRISQVSRITISARLRHGWTEKAAVWTPVRRWNLARGENK